MMRNTKRIRRDVDVLTDSLPGVEILQGKVYKQYGTLHTPEGSSEYFIERHPNSECEIEMYDLDMSPIKVKAAVFEVWVKDPDTGEWICGSSGPAPIDMDLYNGDTVVIF
jgi:hypothetical protein